MKKVLSRTFLGALLVASASIFGLSACASKGVTMALAPKGTKIEQPESGKAQIVFMRASSYYGGKNFSIFEIIDNKPVVVGTLAPYTKVAYSLTEGKHMFLVSFTGGHSGLMEVDAVAGKTYYSYMKVHAGMFASSTSFEPYDKSVSQEDIDGYLKACDLVVLNEKTLAWVKKNQYDITQNYKEALEDWNDEDDEDRVRLLTSDGR